MATAKYPAGTIPPLESGAVDAQSYPEGKHPHDYRITDDNHQVPLDAPGEVGAVVARGAGGEQVVVAVSRKIDISGETTPPADAKKRSRAAAPAGRARKATAKKSTAKTSTARKATAKKATAKKSAAKKSAASRPTARRSMTATAARPKASSEYQLVADKANAEMEAAGHKPAQNVSANEVGYVAEVVKKATKGEVVAMLGFKTEKGLRAFVQGKDEKPADPAKLREFTAKVKALHPSPRIRPRKVAAAALMLAAGGSA